MHDDNAASPSTVRLSTLDGAGTTSEISPNKSSRSGVAFAIFLQQLLMSAEAPLQQPQSSPSASTSQLLQAWQTVSP
ncbi:hypothetical protein RBWH47_01670 [Rhodopirellula baltica WH47]|nr:hypothetical protein RBWH47_01670 [Rhodopirellula baltica WH47]